MRPEILAIGREKIDAYLAAEPRLRQYRMYFDDILRAAPHTLTPAEEKVLARMSALGDTGGTVQSVFRSADMPFPEMTLASGEKVRLDAAGYAKHRASPNKADRDAAFKAFWTRYNEFTRTLAATLNAHVRRTSPTRTCASSDVARRGAVRLQHPAQRLHATARRRAREPADAASLPEAAPEDHGPAAARLRGPLCADRAAGEPRIHAGAGDGADARLVRAARQGIRRDAAQGLRRRAGWTSCRTPARAPARTAPWCTACTRTSCSTSTVPGTTSRRWRTSRGTRCTRTCRTRTSPMRRRAIRRSWPRWPRR